jgi:hypothetical protein
MVPKGDEPRQTAQETRRGVRTPKEDADAAKRKIEAYSKLKDKIKQDRDAVKAEPTAKEAKALIEKIAYP